MPRRPSRRSSGVEVDEALAFEILARIEVAVGTDHKVPVEAAYMLRALEIAGRPTADRLPGAHPPEGRLRIEQRHLVLRRRHEVVIERCRVVLDERRLGTQAV